MEEKEIKLLEKALSGKPTKDNFYQGLKLASYYIGCNPHKAEESTQILLQMANLMGTAEEIAFANKTMGSVNSVLGNHQEAIPYYQKAVNLFSQIGKNLQMAQSLASIASMNTTLGNTAQALKTFMEVIPLFEQENDQHSIAITYSNMANIYKAKMDYAQAIQYYQKAADLAESIQCLDLQVSSLCIMGSIYSSLMDYNKNLACCLKALTLAESTGNNYLIGEVHCSLGVAYQELQDYDKALEYYYKSLKIGREQQIPYYISGNLSNIADIYRKQGKLKEALKAYKEALKYDLQTGDIYNQSASLRTIALTYIDMHRYALARKTILQALNIISADEHLEMGINLQADLLLTCIKQQDYKYAEALLKKLLKKVQDNLVSEVQISIYEYAAGLYTKLRNYKKANYFLNLHSQLYKEFINQEREKINRFMQISFETARLQDEKEMLQFQNELLEKRVQAELNKIKEKDKLLAQQEQLAMLGKISAGIAHEINNPLAAIKQIVEITLEDLNSLQPRGYLSQKKNDVLQLLERINRLVEIIKVIARSPERFNANSFSLNQIIEEFIELFGDKIISKDVLLIKDCEPDLPPVYADNIRFIQLLSILATNSNDALKDVTRSEGKYIKISTKLMNDRILLTFEDNGCGMDQETLSRATEPFFSSKEIGQGTGLGLSLAHSIVLNSNGNMTMESELGKGTSVSLSFPVEDHYEKQ